MKTLRRCWRGRAADGVSAPSSSAAPPSETEPNGWRRKFRAFRQREHFRCGGSSRQHRGVRRSSGAIVDPSTSPPRWECRP
jgi:hypothetical protein